MYPTIYDRNETDFKHNGLGVLKDVIKCEISEEDNGLFELEGECTVSSFLVDKIKRENIIKAWTGEELGYQLFRIYRVKKNLNGNINFYGQHITYDLLDNFVESVEAINVNCETAINEILNCCAYSTPFRGHSDITHNGIIALQMVNPMQAIKGIRGSICDTYGNGAKVIKDNFDIRVMHDRGKNNNVLVAYKKNMTGFESDEPSTDDLTTVIYPYAKVTIEQEGMANREETITLPEKYIYSKYAKNYNNLKIKPIDFSDEAVKDVESLRKKAETYFERTKCDIPEINYKVEFLKLSDTIDYADYKSLEDVNMGDTVIVRDYRFNLNIEARVIKTKYCSLKKKLISCELGCFKYSINNVIGGINNSQANINDRIDKIKINIDNEVGKIHVNIKDESTKLQNNIIVTAEGIRTEVKDAKEGLESTITQTAREIRTELQDTKNGLESNISQTAERIRTEVKDTKNGLESSISQTAGAIRGEITDAKNGLQSQINWQAGEIATKVSNGTFDSYKRQTAEEISSKVSNGTFESYKTQTANEISSKVSSGDVYTLMQQNATSWGLSIWGKLYGTNYTFDGQNFSIGTTNGNDRAYHSSTYSRWNHHDGSYTMASSNGLEHYSGGYKQPYHYMFDVALVDANGKCNGTWFRVQLPQAFRGKRFTLAWQMGNLSVPYDKVSAGHQVDVRNIDYDNATCEVSVKVFTKSKVSGGASADAGAYGWAKIFILY